MAQHLISCACCFRLFSESQVSMCNYCLSLFCLECAPPTKWCCTQMRLNNTVDDEKDKLEKEPRRSKYVGDDGNGA